MIVGAEPIFTVTDVQRAVDHYQRLGFSTSSHDKTYAFAHRDDLTIHLAHRDDPAEGPSALYLHVDDADQLAAAWRQAGMHVTCPEDFDYGKREGSHTDPDGNKIRFGSPLPDPARTMPRTMTAAARPKRRPQQLATIQAGHPGAEVRQGRGRRWEIWPAPSRPGPSGQ